MSHELMVAIYEEAEKAAAKAAEDYLRENPHDIYCGFAWVTIRPATCEFVKMLKTVKAGSPGDRGGWTLHNPSRNKTQSMSAKEEGARIFAEILREYGIRASAQSRAD